LMSKRSVRECMHQTRHEVARDPAGAVLFCTLFRISHRTNPALFPPPFAADPGTQIGVSVYVSLLPTGRLMGS